MPANTLELLVGAAARRREKRGPNDHSTSSRPWWPAWPTSSRSPGLPEGFRAADLRQHLAALSGNDPAAISQSAVTHQLRRLRLHGLIERTPNSFRYRVTDFGCRIALFFTQTYNRLLRPGLAAALPALRAIPTPLKRAFDALAIKIDETLKRAHLGAQT